MSAEPDPGRFDAKGERTHWLAVALGLGLYLAQIPFYWSYFTDDSYIYARMAQNLAQSGQLVFNPDQWVNAATSPLWALLGGLGAWLHFPPLVVFKFLGWTVGALAVLFFARAASRSLPSRGWSIAATLVFATEPWFVRWAGSGLETALGTLVVVLVLDLASRPPAAIPHGRLGLVLGFGALVRPELLLLGGLVCARLWLGREDGGRVRFILAWLAPVLLWSAIAYHAFGAVVPTTLQAKSTPIGLRPARFVNNLVTLLSLISVGAGLTLVGMVPTLRRLRRFENWNWLDPVLLLWLVLLPCIYLVKDVTLVSRYLEILLPVLLLLSCQGLATMRWQSGARAVVLAELVLSLGMSMLWIAPSVRAYSASAEITLGRIADWLRENTPRDDLVAIYDIGLVGYRSHRTILDLGGLVHPGINRLRNRVDDELILREGLFLRFATPQWLVDRRETPRALDGGILGRFRLQAVLDGEVSNLGLMHPEPVYYTLYRLLPLSD